MASPVYPILANLYMEEVEGRALITFTGNGPIHWFRYVDDTWVKIRAGEVEAFTEHINAVDNKIKTYLPSHCPRNLSIPMTKHPGISRVM